MKTCLPAFWFVVTALLSLVTGEGPLTKENGGEIFNVDFESLAILDKTTLESMTQAFTGTGMLAIRNVPRFAQLRQELYETAATCIEEVVRSEVVEEELDFFLTTRLADGTIRRSFGFLYGENFEAGADIDEHLRSIPSCLQFHRNYLHLKVLIDQTSRFVTRGVDAICQTKRFTQFHKIEKRILQQVDDVAQTSSVEHYGSLFDLYANGNQLHHMHLYNQTAEQEEKALAFHTDHGLFLAFVPGLILDDKRASLSSRSNQEFLVRVSNDRGTQVTAPIFPDEGDVLVFMLGDAVQKLINPICAHQLVPTEHALDFSQVPFPTKDHYLLRGWFGAMIIPPVDALSFESAGQAKASVGDHLLEAYVVDSEMPLDETFRSKSALHKDQVEKSSNATIGCSRELNLVELAKGGCRKGTMFCWMQCMPYSEVLNPASCEAKDSIFHPGTKHSLQCATPEGIRYKGGMCTDCGLMCLAEEAKKNSTGGALLGYDESFCSGLPSVMYMNGFSLDFSKRENDACIVFLFSGWEANNFFKYWVVVFFSFALGVIVEYVVYIRRTFQNTGQLYLRPSKFLKSLNHRDSPGSETTFLTDTTMLNVDSRSYKVKFMLLHVLQVVVGYFAMLIAMTYSTVLFTSVVLGICCGHLMFNYKEPVTRGEVCCDFLNDTDQRTKKTELSVLYKSTDAVIDMEVNHSTLRKRSTKTTPQSQRDLEHFLDADSTEESSPLLS